MVMLCGIFPYCLMLYSHDAYNSLWYMHSNKLQKYFTLIIFYGQIPRNYDGYIIKCSLEVFTTVTNITLLKVSESIIKNSLHIVKASGSYYLMLTNFKWKSNLPSCSKNGDFVGRLIACVSTTKLKISSLLLSVHI